MSRREFSKEVKREALRRSGGACEALGSMYGLADGHKCGAPLAYGVQFDHVVADGIGGAPTIDNCAAVCRRCHDWKTAHHDTPAAAKLKRQRDRNQGIKRTGGRPLPGTRASGMRRRMNGQVERW